jgi:hypothetical protein
MRLASLEQLKLFFASFCPHVTCSHETVVSNVRKAPKRAAPKFGLGRLGKNEHLLLRSFVCQVTVGRKVVVAEL